MHIVVTFALCTLLFAAGIRGFVVPGSNPESPLESLAATRLGSSGTQAVPTPTEAPELDDRQYGVPLTINVVHQYPGIGPLSVFYKSNTNIGADGFATPVPAPYGNPGPGTFTDSTQLVVPTGWAGNMAIGRADMWEHSFNSLIEGSYVTLATVDVSYVDGYTVPITCSCQGVPLTGCNVELWNKGNQCEKTWTTGNYAICENHAPNPGPPYAFFADCRGTAYTYPQDDRATSYGYCETKVIDCCVGPMCPRPANQIGWND